MQDRLQTLIEALIRNRSRYSANEEATKQGVVLPLLATLGWDRDNVLEVFPEFSAGSGRVDYSLMRGQEPLVFVEVKRLDEALGLHQEQLLRYAFERGAQLAALTDGLRWWLYLPTQPGSWDQRKFFTIDLVEQGPADASVRLTRFLGKDNVVSGQAVEAARQIHDDRARSRLVEAAIPVAWSEMCEEPDPQLIEILSERVEARCGHPPDPERLAEFLALVPHSRPTAPLATATHTPATPTRQHQFSAPDTPTGEASQWTFHAPESYAIFGHTYAGTTFKDILLRLAAVLYEKHSTDFWPKASAVRTRRGNAYFASSPEGLQEPREIGSGVYIETCLSANGVRDRCYTLLELFGYSPESLVVNIRDRRSR